MSKASPIEEIFPLSPLQKGLLFHTLYAPGEGMYFEQLTCELHGRLDEAAFVETWRLLMARHPILRTAFVWKGQREPVQVVHRALEMPWRREDWRAFTPEQQAEKLSAHLADDRRRGFEPNRAPLMRLATLQLSDTLWQLVWSHHHLLLDGWSFPLLLREFALAYEAYSAGTVPALPPARPFGTYLQWLQKRDASQDERFWREQLRGFSVPTPLTIDRPGKSGGDFEVIDFALDEADTARLQQIARDHRVTLNTLSQGAYALVLTRYAGTSDAVFGITVSGRPPELPGVENIVGLFINTLPLRVPVPDDAEAGPWLRELQDRQIALQEHGHAALGDIQGWSEVPRGQRLFESLFVFINYPVGNALNAKFGELEPRQTRFIERTSYPLTIDVLPGARLTLRTAFELSRFDREAVLRLLGHIRRALLGLGEGNVRLGEIALVAGEERAALLAASVPQAPVEDLREGSLHAWFARQASATPAAIAITAKSGTLTYVELDRAANAVAHRLRGLGVRRGTLVGLLLERDAPLVVALLGILKAGGAYVPLDSNYPDERLDFTIKDSAVPVVVTSGELSVRISDPTVKRLELDGAVLRPRAEDCVSPLAVVNEAEDPAYVIYTSGSTGRPKGCVITHRNVLRLFTATETWYNFGPSDVWTFFHSAAFDFSVWEIWGALLYGGRLVVVPYFTSREPAAFCELLVRERVTVLNQTPSAFRQLMKTEEALIDPNALSLRYVIFGGEALEFASLRPWFERHGDSRPQLVNMYGITETTVHTTYRPLRRADAYEGQGSIIGQTIPDTPSLILDSRGHLSPIGVPGELHVAGVSLARGYLNRPELTAQRFVPDSFGVSVNGKLYRSGDLARRLPNGDIDYLGRIDQQVKIRGFRIELGEIENGLSTHPAVLQAVVMARVDAPGTERRLVAYVVPRGDETLTAGMMREHLRTHLPEYMVPAAFVVLDRLPLTGNGKVDRRALPEPTGLAAEVAVEYVAPRTARERILAEIWQVTLGVDRVGVTTSYFTLGGDSITAITVCSRARERGIQFSLQDLFEKQTVEALAAEAATPTPLPAAQPALEAFALVNAEDRGRLPAGLADAYPVTRLQAGMLFHSHAADGSAQYHDVFSHHLRGPLDLAALQAEFDGLVQRHAALRTGFDVATFSEPLQLVYAEASCPLVESDISHLSPEAQEEWLDRFVRDETKRAFEWGRPPLVRAHLHRRHTDEFQFTLSLHHAIVDGWTLATLLTELFQCYLARIGRGAKPAPNPLPSVRFADYVALERAALSDENTGRFWKDTLAGSEVLELPPGEPEVSAAVGAVQCPIQIPPVLSAALTRTAEQLGLPLKSVLLAAHLRVLSAIGGRDDIVTGLVTNGRPEVVGIENLAGLFLNTVPFRVALGAAPDWAGLVRAVFAAEKALLPHRRLPLAEIQKRYGGAPLFTTDFNFVHFHVYDALRGLSALERLGTRAREETNFTLAVNFSVDPGTGLLGGSAVCDRGALDARVIEALPALYLTVLKAIVDAPIADWRSVPLRTGEAASIDGERVDFPDADLPLHMLFARQVERSPDIPAVVDSHETLTYAALDRRADQLAYWLRRRGVRADDRVAVALERSTGLVVAMLGILKAGAAYVPIDPGYPAERISAMLEDCGAKMVLAETVAFAAGAVDFRAAREEISREAAALPAVTVESAQLAYVIFTSGSTGRPKGIAISHAAIVNHMRWMQRAFPLGTDDVVLQKTPISFDASVWEFWAPLLAGARLVMAQPGGHQDPAYMAKALRSHGITTLQLVPSMLEFVIEEVAKTPCPSLRRVFSGGEPLRAVMRDHFQKVLPQVPLVNLYGPAECTIDATFAVCASNRPITIGGPVANLQAYVLDSRMEPVIEGVAGELYFGGVGLGRGYVGRPDQTAERFVPHPWRAGARLYRTGDRVRQLADGTLLYVGRFDAQVKIRGHRVEPGEVESVLATHPDVAQVAVIAREMTAGLRLVAFVVMRAGTSEAAGLRDWLRHRVPEAMVPWAIVPLASLPLTPGGKVDRRALPSEVPLPATPPVTAPASAQTPAERALVEIWQRTLNVAQVGAQDNFFELGGDSILSLRVVSLALRAGWKLRPLQIFEHPVLSALALVALPVSEAAVIVEEQVIEDVPLTPIQCEFFALKAPNPHHWNQAVLLETRAGLTAAALAEAWRSVTRRHASFRLRFQQAAGGWKQRLAPPSVGSTAFEVVDLQGVSTEKRPGAIEQAANAAHGRLDISEGPLARAVYFDAGANAAGRLLCVAHHLCIDGVSWRILLDELGQMAEALAAAATVELPPPTTSFPAWASHVPKLAASPETRAESDYWRGVATAVTARLPLDYADGHAGNREDDTASVVTQLTIEETDLLLRAAPAVARSRVEEVLLSALLAAAQDWTGADEMRVHLEGHGRDYADAPDLSRSLGWFTTLYPILIESGREADAAARLRNVKEALRAVPRHGIGYGWLRHVGRDDALVTASPAQISFNYLGRLDLALESEGPFRPAAEPAGREHAPDSPRAHLLDVVAAVAADGLRVQWIFSQRVHRRETIARVGERFAAEVRALLGQFRTAGGQFSIAADFPLARLSSGDLSRVLERRGEQDVWPLAPLQEGMLVHALHDGIAGMYGQQLAFELRGEPDPAALARAWRAAADRHPALRLEFVWEEMSVPCQIVRREIEVPLESHDWSACTVDDQASRWTAWLATDRARGFPLNAAPLWRVTLFKLGNARWRLVWSHHHLLLDGWSLPLVFRDVLAAYGEPNVALPPAPSYRDYLAWLVARKPGAEERFWRDYLAGYRPAQALTFGGVPNGAQASSTAHRSACAELTAEMMKEVKEFAQSREVTLSTCAQAAWALVLARHLGTEEAGFGLVVSGRPAEVAGVESIVGLFINTLPLRVSVPGDERTVTWLKRLQAQAAALREFEASRLVDIQGWSDVPRGQALFDSVLIYENYPTGVARGARSGGLELGAVESFEHTNYPLTLYVLPGDGLTLRLDFAESRFTDEAMRVLVEQVASVLRSLVAGAERPVATLNLQEPATTVRDSLRWNVTARTEWDRTAVHFRFAVQAKRTPHAIAVVGGDMTLSFAECEARSNQLARFLGARGAGPGRLVGICLQRSSAMVVAMLAILKTGAAYVPLDPAFPPARLAMMREDSGLVLAVTDTALAGLPGLFPPTVLCVCLDADSDAIRSQSTSPVMYDSSGDELAYVIFTSGSTGRPKGVQVTHGGLANFLSHFADSPGLRSTDTLVAVTTLSFDIAALEIFLPLVTGARVVVAPREIAADARGLAVMLATERATVMQATPATWRLLLSDDWKLALPLRAWCGGEAMPTDLAAALLARGCEVWNLYGPTETTIWSATQPVAVSQDALTIGGPIAHTSLHVLDANGNPLPAGIAGELFIGGEGLARGYHGRADLTAEKFVPSPFGSAGARLYATGDLVRRWPDGRIEFAGRVDQQVKLRGFRIELGEIETALRAHPGVRAAAVALREDGAGEKRLVAYIVGHGDVSAVALREHLRVRVPDYMLPSGFVTLPALPLTPNGKLDRRSLPAPEWMDAAVAEYLAPRDATEQVLADLWLEVLGVGRVGARGNFFELGGHSLLAAQALARIRRIFHVDLPLRTFFETATPEKVAIALNAADSVPGRVLKRATALLQIREMSPADRAAALERRRANTSAANR